MIFRDNFIATGLLLVAVCFGTGCDKQTKQADLQPNQPSPPTSVTDTDTGTGGDGNPNDPARHPLKDTTLKVYQDKSGACYTDQAWLDVIAGTDTVAWSSGDGKSSFLLEFYSTPLRTGNPPTTPAYVVTVPPTTSSTRYALADYNSNCKNSPSAASCYFQYQIVKVPSSSTSKSDICGPSPLTVGIHIKP